jgi:tetratricopeptide (TPR) repeat protein
VIVLLEPKAHNEALKDPEFLWRYGRALYNHTRELNEKDKAQEKQRMQQAFEYIEQSLALHDASSEAHKWYGIVLDQVASYEGTKRRIEQSYEVEKHFRRALELDPQNAGALYSLGVWHFEFAVSSLAESACAKVLVAFSRFVVTILVAVSFSGLAVVSAEDCSRGVRQAAANHLPTSIGPVPASRSSATRLLLQERALDWQVLRAFARSGTRHSLVETST